MDRGSDIPESRRPSGGSNTPGGTTPSKRGRTSARRDSRTPRTSDPDAADLLDGDLDLIGADAMALDPARFAGSPDGLGSKVLVLNRAYVAMRIISARRAFCLLLREHAEVIHVDGVAGEGGSTGGFLNYDFATWAELSILQKQFEPDRFDWVKTPRIDIAVPRIIRLLGYDRLPDQTVKLNRRNLFARDRNQCQYCGRHFPTADLSIDHVKPRSLGGLDTWENLVCACIRCNARKGGRTPEQASMKLIRPSVRPKRNPMISIRLGSEKYRTWKAFLDNAYWDVELR